MVVAPRFRPGGMKGAALLHLLLALLHFPFNNSPPRPRLFVTPPFLSSSLLPHVQSSRSSRPPSHSTVTQPLFHAYLHLALSDPAPASYTIPQNDIIRPPEEQEDHSHGSMPDHW